MSSNEVTIASAPQVPVPTGPEPASTLLRFAFPLMGLLLVLLVYLSWLENSGVVRAARQQLRRDQRVVSEFGPDIDLPLFLAWDLNGTPTIIAYVKGNAAHGFAFLRLARINEEWAISGGEIRDTTENHVLSFASITAIARVNQLPVQRRLYLVAIGRSAHKEVLELSNFFQQECGIQAQLLPDMEFPERGFDASRKQWIAEMLVDEMARQFPDIAQDQDARIMAVVDSDIYPRSLGWDFTFNYRYANKYAVLQTARLNPGFYRLRPSQSIMTERLLKTALKCLGLLYFDFQDSARPESVMSFEGTLEKIDEQAEHYLTSDLALRTNTENFSGKPCLTFSRVNVSGLTALQPIRPCYEPYDLSQGSYHTVNLSSGEFRTERNDLYRSGPLPFVLHRVYASHSYEGKVRAFGKSAGQNLDDTVWSVDPQSIQEININGVQFRRVTPGVGFSPLAKYRAPREAGEFSSALLSWDRGGWKVETSTGVWRYLGCEPNSRVPCYFMSTTDLYGDQISVDRDGNGHIEGVIQSATNLPAMYNRTWTFTYDGDRIREIVDQTGRAIQYLYDSDNYVSRVDQDDNRLRYGYDANHRMNEVDEDGTILHVHFDQEGRVVQIDFGVQPTYRIHYGGETVDVKTPTQTYLITLRDSFFSVRQQ